VRAERFEDLVAWQKARELAGAVYEITRKRELAGDYALVRQMQRAAVSITANIAEGFGRAGVEFHRFVTIARGSCFELLSHLYLACDVGYVRPAEFQKCDGTWRKSRASCAHSVRVSNERTTTQAPKPEARRAPTSECS
jgi:four helix bundle protein